MCLILLLGAIPCGAMSSWQQRPKEGILHWLWDQEGFLEEQPSLYSRGRHLGRQGLRA